MEEIVLSYGEYIKVWQILEEQPDNSRQWLLPSKSEMIRHSISRLRGRDRKGPLWEYMPI